MIPIELPKSREMLLEIKESGFAVDPNMSVSLITELYFLVLIYRGTLPENMPDRAGCNNCFGTFESNSVCTGSTGSAPCALRKPCSRLREIQEAIKAGIPVPKAKENVMSIRTVVDDPATDPQPKTPKIPAKKRTPANKDEFGFKIGTQQSGIASAICAGGKKSDIIDTIVALGVSSASANIRYHNVKKIMVARGVTVTESGTGKDKTVTVTSKLSPSVRDVIPGA